MLLREKRTRLVQILALIWPLSNWVFCYPLGRFCMYIDLELIEYSEKMRIFFSFFSFFFSIYLFEIPKARP